MGGDPAAFHESLCRASFKQTPVVGDHGTGIDAQRAILFGGTLSNGKLQLQKRVSHGVAIRELIAMQDFPHGQIVTCYGGLLELAPTDKKQTHMRCIPATNYVLNGVEFSKCFPCEHGAELALGVYVSMLPRCQTVGWATVICTTGLGYMANAVTRCPLQGRVCPNVTVHRSTLGREVPGVPYSDVLYFRAALHGIRRGQPVISPYEACRSNPDLQFTCCDPAHYRAAGRQMMPLEEVCSVSE